MDQNWLSRVLLSPFSLLYGIGVTMRNLCYDAELLKSSSFSLPVISVGNLSIGGAGKTPHVEYLIKLLKDYANVATLSRGYKRKTKGFKRIMPRHNALFSGDEPLMYKRKYPDIEVSVAESRTLGIPAIVKSNPAVNVILLDDAYQHRSVAPGLNILLTDYNTPFSRDYLLPAGRLREWRSAYERADVIIVTKCPADLDKSAQEKWQTELNVLPHQRLYFSKYKHLKPYSFSTGLRDLDLLEDSGQLILISAIASTSYLRKYLNQTEYDIHYLEYEDHHNFTVEDLDYISQVFENAPSANKIILTTEKDAVRLDIHRKKIESLGLKIYVLPVEVEFLFDEKDSFDAEIKDFLLNFKV